MVGNMWEDFAVVVAFAVEAPTRSEITQEFKLAGSHVLYDKGWRRS